MAFLVKALKLFGRLIEFDLGGLGFRYLLFQLLTLMAYFNG